MQQFLPNVYNFTPQNMFNTRAGLSRVRSGSGNARILCIGDSTTFGAYSNGGVDTGDIISKAYPAQLAKFLNGTQGLNAHANSFYGLGSSSDENRVTTSSDPRITLGSGWAVGGAGGSGPTPGGQEINGQKTSAGNASFLPTQNVDTFQVFYGRGPVGAQLGLNINGAGGSTVNTNGSTTALSTTITGTLASSTLNFVPTAGTGTFYDVFGASAWDSSKSWIDVMNCGWPGASSGGVVGLTGYTLAMHLAAIAPNLTILNHGINDALASPGETLATYISQMQTIITAALAVGDVVLASPNPIGSGTTVPLSSYASAMYQLAEINNIPFIDTFTRWGGSETAYGAAGMMGTSNSTHPNQNGYADIASGISKLIIAL